MRFLRNIFPNGRGEKGRTLRCICAVLCVTIINQESFEMEAMEHEGTAL